ncbi:MAG: magnesium transporter [Alphaproteobacteria bacterium]|nr:magnesium transporter [Alphaproteobacteria bacterium]
MSRESDDLAELDKTSRIQTQNQTPAADEDLEDLALGEDYALNPEYVPLVADALDRGDAERLRDLLSALRPEDIADLMGFLSPPDREELIPHLDPETLGEVIAELDTEIREDVLEHVPSATLAKALGEMESDDAADVVDDLEEDKRAQVLAAMPEVERAAIETTLGYEEETAGRLMQREVVAAPQFWSVGQTIDHLRADSEDLPELFFDVYVVDPAYKPVGAAPVSHLLRTRRDVPLAQIMEPVTEIPVGMDQEEVAYIFNKYHLISAPVVEPGGRLVGQITVDDIVGVIQEETEEDILALHGVSDAGRDASILGITRSRFWWLLVNLGTAILASSVIAIFQGVIAKLAVLAVLNPIVASMGGNAGTQTLAVAVRALATRELTAANAWRIIWRETAAGLLNGLAFAVVMGLVTVLWFHTPMMAVIIGLAMVINLFAAAVAGILIPLALDRMGYDPAQSAVVFLTTVTDCVGFFSFLGLAALLLF